MNINTMQGKSLSSNENRGRVAVNSFVEDYLLAIS